MIEAYLATLAGVALAQASPGPNMLAVAGAALGSGRRAALWTVAGIATAMLVWAAAVAVGLAAILELYPPVLTTMKLVGGAYLLWLAVKGLRAAIRGEGVAVTARASAHGAWRSWRNGLAVVLTNPKAALMWTAVGTYLFGSGLTAVEVALFGPIGAVSALLVYGGYALAFSTGAASRVYGRFSRAINAGIGGAFGLLGGSLVADALLGRRT